MVDKRVDIFCKYLIYLPELYGRSEGEHFSREIHKSVTLAHPLEAPYGLQFS